MGLFSNVDDASKSRQWLAKAVYAAQHTQSRNHAKLFITKLVKEDTYQSIEKGDTKVEDYEVNVSAIHQAKYFGINIKLSCL